MIQNVFLNRTEKVFPKMASYLKHNAFQKSKQYNVVQFAFFLNIKFKMLKLHVLMHYKALEHK